MWIILRIETIWIVEQVETSKHEIFLKRKSLWKGIEINQNLQESLDTILRFFHNCEFKQRIKLEVDVNISNMTCSVESLPHWRMFHQVSSLNILHAILIKQQMKLSSSKGQILL